MCYAEKHFAGICTHDELMQMLKYRNKSDGYLKRIDEDFPKSMSKPPTQRKKHYYALKDVYPYVEKINALYDRKEEAKAELARQTLIKIRSGQPREVLAKIGRITAVHDNFRELEAILKAVKLPVRQRSKHRDACLTAIKFYMQRQTAQARLRVVQRILNWLDHEEKLKQQARL